MARPLKEGFDYFPFDVDFFQNKKIRAFIRKRNYAGICVYIYLLCVIYGRKGYFVKNDVDLVEDVAWNLQLTDDEAEKHIEYMLEKVLFSQDLATDEKILTSKGIQRRFQEMSKTRGKTKIIHVVQKIWLLVKEETESFIKVTLENGFFGKNSGFCEENEDKTEENTQSKESKSNKVNDEMKINEVNDSSCAASTADEVIGKYKSCRDFEQFKRFITDDGMQAEMVYEVLEDMPFDDIERFAVSKLMMFRARGILTMEGYRQYKRERGMMGE